MKFEELQIDPDILKVLHELKFEEPTEIQEKTIPLMKQGLDVIGESATGSGKTLAFAVRIIEKTIKGEGIQALILVPTRELCEQVSKEMRKFSKYKHLSVTAVYGGVSYGQQIENLENTEIVVGTPGRILDHLKRKTFALKKVKILVIDETDRMFDMGFIYDVTDIINHTPNERQTMLFSATINSDIEHIGRKYMKNPKMVSAVDHVDPSLLKQYYYEVPQNAKFSLLVHLLKEERSGLVMVFCNTRQNVNTLAKNLKRIGIEAYPTHGGLTQSNRNRVMELFRSHQIHVLIASDVAARGLDIKNVSHIYNYDLPKTEDEYIHRIGRTARAGKEGMAISLISDRDYENFYRIKRDERINMEKLPLPKFEQKFFKIFDRRDQGFSGRFRSRSYSRGDQRREDHGGFRPRSDKVGHFTRGNDMDRSHFKPREHQRKFWPRKHVQRFHRG